MTDLDEILEAARELGRAARWPRALRLLDATAATDPAGRARVALAAAEIALDSDWFAGTDLAAARLAACPAGGWDAEFLRLRHGYLRQLLGPGPGSFAFGPDGKDARMLDGLRRAAHELRDQAPDALRRGWAEMYLGLIVDNLFAERDAARSHYTAALQAAENVGPDKAETRVGFAATGAELGSGRTGAEVAAAASGSEVGSAATDADLLAREALRHLGDHDRDAGDHALALHRWQRATALGARTGLVPGVLSQQILLAVLARDAGDEDGARLLAGEVARWAEQIGMPRLRDQATAFLSGAAIA